MTGKHRLIYSLTRWVVCPFVLIFSIIFGISTIFFLGANMSLYPLLWFSFGLAFVYCLSFLVFNFIWFKKIPNFLRGNVKAIKISLVVLADLLMIAIAAFAIQVVASQNAMFGNGLSFLATSSLGVISTIFIALFTLIFYFSEPEKRQF